MDPAVGRIPAWQRLGLKLRNDDQSGPAVPESIGLESVRNQPKNVPDSRRDIQDIHQFTGPTENGKPLKLGKRKAQDDPAERVSSKKSRKSEEQGGLNGKAADTPATRTKEENEKQDTPLSKGDPNYRKKKTQRTKPSSKQVTPSLDPNEAASAVASHSERSRKHARKRSRSRSLSPREPDSADGATLLPSTETELPTSPPYATSHKPKKVPASASTAQGSSPPQTDRRKSVTFTPDTKTTDGNSASNLFKKWVAEQKAAGAETGFSAAEVAQFVAPSKVHPANSVSATLSLNPEGNQGEPTPAGPVESKQKNFSPKTVAKITEKSAVSKKKDPSLYLGYLSLYHNDRGNWKFNKVRQNDVIENALNIFRITDEYSGALVEYVKGLKGAGVINRLRENCNNILQDQKDTGAMDDAEVREAAQEEALQERLIKEKKRRRVDADIENLGDHPYPEGYIRRLKRRRAEALLDALNLASPIQPPASLATGDPSQRSIASEVRPAVTRKPPKKSKVRTEASSDESPSESSSDSESENSSSDSDSESRESQDESESDSSTSGDGVDSSEDEASEDEASEDEESENGESEASGDSDDDSTNTSSSESSVEGSEPE